MRLKASRQVSVWFVVCISGYTSARLLSDPEQGRGFANIAVICQALMLQLTGALIRRLSFIAIHPSVVTLESLQGAKGLWDLICHLEAPGSTTDGGLIVPCSTFFSPVCCGLCVQRLCWCSGCLHNTHVLTCFFFHSCVTTQDFSLNKSCQHPVSNSGARRATLWQHSSSSGYIDLYVQEEDFKCIKLTPSNVIF